MSDATAHGLITAIITFAASAVGAFFAAWWGGVLGVRREGKKLTQAQAFNRRLEWYERAISALRQLSLADIEYDIASDPEIASDPIRSAITSLTFASSFLS